MSLLTVIDHVQLAIPAGGEDQARQFFVGLLGLEEVPKPAVLAGRGGCWFERGAVIVHCGVDPRFVPATKAHIAFRVTDVEALAEMLERHGHPVAWDKDFPSERRFYAADPFGNRLEFMAAAAPAGPAS